MDPRGVARIDAILDNELGRLLDGRLEPRGIEARVSHVGNLWRLWTLKSDRADPHEAVLFPGVEFIHEIVSRPGPRASHGSLGVFPAVVRALDASVTNPAGRQGGATVLADIGLNARDEVLVAPNDVIFVFETHAAGLLTEGGRTGHGDPTFHYLLHETILKLRHRAKMLSDFWGRARWLAPFYLVSIYNISDVLVAGLAQLGIQLGGYYLPGPDRA